MYKPFQVITSDDPRLAGQGYDDFCWVLVETHPNGTIARIIANDGGEPEDQNLVRDYSWVPDILNEYYVNYRVEIEAQLPKFQEKIPSPVWNESNKENQVRMSVYIDPVLKDYVMELARESKVSLSRVVEQALQQYVSSISIDRANEQLERRNKL
jgi:hypothetical protein